MEFSRTTILAALLSVVAAMRTKRRINNVHLDDSVTDHLAAELASNSEAVGFICCAFAVFFFGSNFLPVKKVDAGDGMWFALCMAVGIFAVGVCAGLYRSFAVFYPFAMLGGALWATGNAFTVVVIQSIGLGPGLLVWGMTNMLTGWATGYFGLFGVDKEDIAKRGLNIFGVVLAVSSLVIFSRVKTGGDGNKDETEERERSGSFAASEASFVGAAMTTDDASPIGKLPETTKKIIGFTLASVAGVFFGSNFNPPTILLNKGKAAKKAGQPLPYSDEVMDYVFAHFCGIFLAAITYFLIYLIATKIRGTTPFVEKKLILPAMASGIGWGLAQVAWFKANDALSLVIAFPIITTMPGVVGSLWGMFLFGELKDTKSRGIFALVVVIQVSAVSLIAYSKN